jgi:hypothetical protein
MAIEPVTRTIREVNGKRVTLGGVTVTVELNCGELDIRVSACDDSIDECERVDLTPLDGVGHGNIYITGDEPGRVSHNRFVIHRKGVFN